jgi:hypothetical protein
MPKTSNPTMRKLRIVSNVSCTLMLGLSHSFADTSNVASSVSHTELDNSAMKQFQRNLNEMGSSIHIIECHDSDMTGMGHAKVVYSACSVDKNTKVGTTFMFCSDDMNGSFGLSVSTSPSAADLSSFQKSACPAGG